MSLSVQREAIPVILEGRDLIGLAQTGTGKTAAYLLPLLHGLLQKRKASTPRRTSILVLVPTRELAYQVSDSIKAFSGSLKVRYLTIVGGERYDHQFRSLKKGVDVLVATPGRFEDLMARGKVDLGDIEHFVLDEGDQMIDLGFLPPIRRIFEALSQLSYGPFSVACPRVPTERSGGGMRVAGHGMSGRSVLSANGRWGSTFFLA